MKSTLNINDIGYGTKSRYFDYGIRIFGYDDSYMVISDLDYSVDII